jgi:rhodanese-related sulfurtransferase
MENNLLATFLEHEDVHRLKSRLEWGQPGFTILDVREHSSFQHGHITGAIPMPLSELSNRANNSLHKHRDIYVYGESDAHAAEAVQILREAGFDSVSELKGGLTAWKNVGGATEGVA